MWPFRRRRRPRLESVPIGELTTDPADYSILTVGQSRLADSFTALDFTGEESPHFVVSRAHPVIDPRVKAIADIELHVDGHVVGYLRPPALNEAIDLLSDRHAEALDIPIAIFSTPAVTLSSSSALADLQYWASRLCTTNCSRFLNNSPNSEPIVRNSSVRARSINFR